MLAERKCWGGLGYGELYELEVLGIDPTGDVAMFRLHAPGRLPFSTLGDSDNVRVGDTVLAMGNPFMLSDDHRPSVSMGIVSGVHRYQWGTGGNLTYSDCIQTDAAINPGNSGGPLFNLDGEVIGINGRISVNTRGRYNVGFGYAISSNQIQRFIPALRAGLVAQHGTLDATVRSDDHRAVALERLASGSPLLKAGLRHKDRLVSFDGAPLQSPNDYVSLLGTYPEDWPIPLEVERDGTPWTTIVRLTPLQPKLRQPFAAPKGAAKREVDRVLARLRPTAPSNAASTESLPSARWKMIRVRGCDPYGGCEHDCYVVICKSGKPADLQWLTADGADGTRIEFTDEVVTWFPAQDPIAVAAPMDMHLIHAGLFELYSQLLLTPARQRADDWTVVGADAPTNPSPLRRGGSSTDGHSPGDRSVWTVLARQLAGGIEAKLSFDGETGRCFRIRMHDRLTGAEATLDLSDHRDVGGVFVPATITIRAAGIDVRDELVEWEWGR